MVDTNFRFILESLIFLRSVYVNVYILSSVSRNVLITCAVVPYQYCENCKLECNLNNLALETKIFKIRNLLKMVTVICIVMYKAAVHLKLI